VIPAVLMYYACFCEGTVAGIEDFLLTAGVIGMLFKKGATISGSALSSVVPPALVDSPF
jgi:L-serine dehydratase